MKICAVVEANLDEIAQTTHAGGQRTRVITPMIRAGIGQDLPADADAVAAAQGDIGWTRLTRLEIGPFRGFRRREVFELDHPTVLVLGPNGSGKSSLCEALELALLGRIEEADERGLDARRYFDNAHEGRHERPVLIARVSGKDVEVWADEARHRFIIVERNRIESFARIGARRPAEANGMLAALFGLTDFNDFVGGFGASLDRQLKLGLPKAAELDRQRVVIQADQTKIASEAETHGALTAEREQVADAFELGLTYRRLKARIGTPQAPGRLQDIRAIQAVQLPAASGIRPDHLIELRRQHRHLTRHLEEARAALAKRAQEVSYRGLYQAVVALESIHPEHCPACETPLAQVVTDPFIRAAAGLQALQELAALEARAADLERQLDRSQGVLEAAVRQAVEHAATLPALVQQAPLDQPWASYGRKGWRTLLSAARVLKRQDEGLAAKRAERDALGAEADRLQAARARLAEIEGRQRQFDADVLAAQERVAVFDAQTAPLVAEVTAEAADQKVEVQIKEAYEAFLALLKDYLAGLPEQLMADLNDITVELYNGFNANDQAEDLIHELRLPLRGGAPLEICFSGDQERWHNALAILSEGHLRCLGLAILLAKNIKLELPTVLLDDAVNAIDHEHREGIRNTLFGHPKLKDKQLIVTCHSPEFIKDIFNNHTKQAPLYLLGHHTGDHHPIVSGGKTRNYIERAEAHIGDLELRGALSCSRQAFENLVTRTWKQLIKEAPPLAVLSLPVRGPGAVPDLRNVADTLLKVVAKATGDAILDADIWGVRRDALDAILKAKINSQAWLSLNKGTHEEEDREDFEEPTVRRVLDALKELDESLGKPLKIGG